MTNLNLEIISVHGVVLKCDCDMVVVPSVEGDLGIMYGHESVITILREGQITVFDDKQNIVKQIDVTGGYAEMHGAEKLSVLID